MVLGCRRFPSRLQVVTDLEECGPPFLGSAGVAVQSQKIGDSQFATEQDQRFHIVQIVIHDDRNHMHPLERTNTGVVEDRQRRDGALECPGTTTLGVVAGWVGVIDGNADLADPRPPERTSVLRVHEPAIGDHYRKVILGRGPDHADDAGVEHRFAAADLFQYIGMSERPGCGRR